MKKSSGKMKVAVIGLHHLGSVVSICLASLKQNVVGIDFEKKTVKNLQSSKFPLYEPGLADLFSKSKKDIKFTTDFSQIKNSDLIYFAQDTETDGSGSTSKLKKLLILSMPYLESKTVIIMSQVPIGFHRNLFKKLQTKYSKINLYHLVDTVIMTQAINRFLKPERLIIGSENAGEKFSRSLNNFLKLFECPVFHMTYESAEVTKAAINLYLATSVTFANNLSNYCEVAGADIREIIPALQSDKRIGPYSYIKPNLRISGGHLERDLLMLHMLAKTKKISPGIVEFILNQNEKRYKWIEKKLNQILSSNHSKKNICIWGLSYKKNSESTVNSPSLFIIKSLSRKYNISVYDPLAVMPNDITGYKRFKDKYEALSGSDVLIILTDWDEFKEVKISKFQEFMKKMNIMDIAGVYSKKYFSGNINYLSLGQGVSS